MKTLDVLLEELDLSVSELAQQTRLPPERVEAIVMGRWTPSSQDRRRIAEALQTSVDDISWGHTMDPRNVRYHRFGLKEDF